VTALKQFFSQQIDRFRPSYGRYAQDFPRQTQFWGSTNQDAYLRDYTGNRRFWPLYCTTVKRKWVVEFRDQLWAEAVHLYKHGERWWVSQETEDDEADYEIVTAAQDARLQRDPWEDLLRPWLDSRATPHVQSAEILKDCIGIDGAHMQPAQMNRLAPIMKSLGWRSTRKRLPLGKNNKKIQVRVWESVDVANLLNEVPL
jgi:putative DNA primase/helicase